MKSLAQTAQAGLLGFMLCATGNVMASSPEPGDSGDKTVGPDLRATIVFTSSEYGNGTTLFFAQVECKNSTLVDPPPYFELSGDLGNFAIESSPRDITEDEQLEGFILPVPPIAQNPLCYDEKKTLIITKVSNLVTMEVNNIAVAEVKLSFLKSN